MNTDIKSELVNVFNSFIESQWYVLGENVIDFEKQYAEYCSTKHAIGVANGLDALIIALKSLGIKDGDEVIVPSNTYIATWLAVSSIGAKPIPVEPNIKTYNINPELIQSKISSKTKAIIPVHLYGQCCEMEEIMNIANSNSLKVIEDNAQAQGATYKGIITGSFGDINATSFYPGKNLGAFGDAGAITTNSELLMDSSKTIRNYGSKIKYYNELQGMNSRLDELQAAFLKLKLNHLNNWNSERVKIAQWYMNNLKGFDQIILPELAENASSVYHLFVIRTLKRDGLQKYLQSKGINTMIHYPVPPHLQKAYKVSEYSKGAFPIAEEIAQTCLSLPIYPGLVEEQIEFICDSIKSFWQ